MDRLIVARELMRIAKKLVEFEIKAKRMSESYWKKYKKEHPKADPRNHEIVPDKPKKEDKDYSSLQSVIKNSGNHCNAIEIANEKYGDVFHTCPHSEYLIERFAENGYKKGSSKRLTQIVCHAFNVEPDKYRANKLLPMASSTIHEFKKYVAHQQEVLRNSPYAVEGDCIILFRNTDNQISRNENKITYKGSNIESWTTNPDFDWKGTKIMAKVPISICIASHIGRNNTGHAFRFQEQCEVMVCGSLVQNVQIVGKDGFCNDEIRKQYENIIKNNIGKK